MCAQVQLADGSWVPSQAQTQATPQQNSAANTAPVANTNTQVTTSVCHI
jgi:hypothetical protein